MKKNCFFLFFILFFVASCNKESTSIIDQKLDSATFTNNSVKSKNSSTQDQLQSGLEKSNNPFLHPDGYLMFESEEKFIAFLKSKEEQETPPENIDNEFGFNSFLNNALQIPENLDILEAVYFAGTLNSDGLVGISDYTFKLIPETKQVFVIKHLKSTIIELQQFQSAKNVKELPDISQVFSFDDDVFALLNDEHIEKEGSCLFNDDDIKEERPYCTNEDDERFRYKLKLHYISLGILKNLYVSWINKCYSNCNSNYNISTRLNISGLYVPRCKNTINVNFGLNQLINQNKLYIPLYSQTRCLSIINLTCWVRFVNPCDQTEQIFTSVFLDY